MKGGGSMLTEIKQDNALIQYLQKVKRAVVAEELAREIEAGGRQELAAVKQELDKLGAALCIPLFFENKLIGLFNLGNKLSQDMYTDEDIDLLTTLANQLAIAIENATLHEEMLKAQKQLLQADKLSALGRLAAGMAHEIKNPLAAIKGMTQAIDKNANDQEFLDDFKRVVPKEIDRLDGLVDGMIQLGRPPRLVFAPVKINALIEDNLKLFEHRCQNHQIAIVKALGQIPEINADPQQLTQVITNLVLNAIQAMPNGGKLSISTRAATDAVILEIADTGRGIPEDKLKDIFEPFFTTREEGLGLGLAITYQIIKGHNGEISVESKVGEGTRFRIALPFSARL
jgi:two-component system, NtrC family, sensor histidine kinase HydH